tara:strand:- start:1513 stop:1956 length:444 start_codon:yes stop_codon:yes gene_type:complete
MTWSYSGDPSSSDRDKVRFLVFDTDTNDQLLSNEELDWLLSQNSNIYMAAATAAEAIAAKFAKDISRSVVGISATPGGRADFYLELAERLRAQVSSTNKHAQVFAGGLSIDNKEALDDDSDAVQPGFKIGQFDYDGPNQGQDYTDPE